MKVTKINIDASTVPTISASSNKYNSKQNKLENKKRTNLNCSPKSNNFIRIYSHIGLFLVIFEGKLCIEAYRKLDSSCNPLNLIRQVDIQIGRKKIIQNQKKENWSNGNQTYTDISI